MGNFYKDAAPFSVSGSILRVHRVTKAPASFGLAEMHVTVQTASVPELARMSSELILFVVRARRNEDGGVQLLETPLYQRSSTLTHSGFMSYDNPSDKVKGAVRKIIAACQHSREFFEAVRAIARNNQDQMRKHIDEKRLEIEVLRGGPSERWRGMVYDGVRYYAKRWTADRYKEALGLGTAAHFSMTTEHMESALFKQLYESCLIETIEKEIVSRTKTIGAYEEMIAAYDLFVAKLPNLEAMSDESIERARTEALARAAAVEAERAAAVARQAAAAAQRKKAQAYVERVGAAAPAMLGALRKIADLPDCERAATIARQMISAVEGGS